MMINKISIFILTFSSAGLFFTQTLPLITDKIARLQMKKFDKTVGKLDNLYIRVRQKRLRFFFILFPGMLAIIAFLVFNNLVAALGGFGLGLVFPTLVVKHLEARRKQKFHDQLIDCLMTLSSSLKSGISVLQAIEVVVEEMPPPMSQELSYVVKEVQMGVSLKESLLRLSKRIYSDDLNMMVNSILLGQKTGGDLTKIFDNLVNTVRQKNKVYQQVKTLTLQSRWQGAIMMALPIFFAFVISRLNPEYFEAMLNSQIGKALLLYAVISQILGMLMIRYLSKVEV